MEGAYTLLVGYDTVYINYPYQYGKFIPKTIYFDMHVCC